MAYESQNYAPMGPDTEDDVIALEIMAKMISHLSPMGHILDLLHELLGTIHDLEGLAADCLGIVNINPKDALNPALAFLASTAVYKQAKPMVAEELRSRGVEQRVMSRRYRALPTRTPKRP